MRNWNCSSRRLSRQASRRLQKITSVAGFEQAVRYASILLDISEGTKRDYDELFIERNNTGIHWIHFAVRPKGNRRKCKFILT